MPNDTLMTDAATPEGAGSQTAATEVAAPAATTETAQAPATDAPITEPAKAGEEAKAEEEQAKPEGAPEKYEFSAPEGATFDTQVIDQFSEVAKELNLPQAAAQKMLDKMGPLMATRQAEVIEAARTQWATDSKADKEFGGDKLDANLAVAKKALDAFGTPALRALLNESGLGNHPELIRFMVRSGAAISEDKIVTGGSGAQAPRDARSLYPNSNLK